MIVRELIEKLKQMPQDKSIICQVVGQESGVWNMDFEVNDIDTSWMVQIKVKHHELIKLPDFTGKE